MSGKTISHDTQQDEAATAAHGDAQMLALLTEFLHHLVVPHPTSQPPSGSPLRPAANANCTDHTPPPLLPVPRHRPPSAVITVATYAERLQKKTTEHPHRLARPAA